MLQHLPAPHPLKQERPLPRTAHRQRHPTHPHNRPLTYNPTSTLLPLPGTNKNLVVLSQSLPVLGHRRGARQRQRLRRLRQLLPQRRRLHHPEPSPGARRWLNPLQTLPPLPPLHPRGDDLHSNHKFRFELP